MASSRPESNSVIVVAKGIDKESKLPRVAQDDFNLLNLRKNIYLFNHVSSFKLSVIVQASFFIGKIDRGRKI